MKTLVVYYSLTGNNEKLAEYLKEKLPCDTIRLETVRKRNGLSILFDLMFNRKPAVRPLPLKLEDYNHVLFLAPIWAGKIAMPMSSLLLSVAQKIQHYSFITVCGGGAESQKEKITSQLKSAIGRSPEFVCELWVKKVIEDRKITGTIKSNVKINKNDLKLFNKEIGFFNDALHRLEEQLASSDL